MTINLGMLLDDALGNHLMQGPVSMIHKKVQMIWISHGLELHVSTSHIHGSYHISSLPLAQSNYCA